MKDELYVRELVNLEPHSVYWSSKIQSWGPFWKWRATVYIGEHEVTKSGFAFTKLRAEVKRTAWLVSQGQEP